MILRSIERAIERIQHPDERLSTATLRRWAATVSAESWKSVEADFRFIPRRSNDFVALAHASSVSCMLDNVENATDSEIDDQEAQARERGDRFRLAMIDSIRRARVDPKEKAGLRRMMLSALRELDGRIVLLFVLRKHKAAALEAIRAANQDEAPFLALLDADFAPGTLEAARKLLARVRRMTPSRWSEQRADDVAAPRSKALVHEHEGIKWTDDCTTVFWGAVRFTFSPGVKRETVRVLLNAWLAGAEGVPASDIAAAVGSNDSHFSPRRQLAKHPALRRMIVEVPGRRGFWTIVPPPEQLPKDVRTSAKKQADPKKGRPTRTPTKSQKRRKH